MIAALFVRKTSHYTGIEGVDCFNEDRDALTWCGGVPGVFHPPCRAWGKLKAFANPRPGERELAVWSMLMVRKFGGVVEHPISSGLWRASGCIGYGMRDEFGGVLFPIMQSWFGHRAPKMTGLYLVGAPIPDLEKQYSDCLVRGRVESMCKQERERTPLPLARWLVDLAASCRVVA